MGSMYSAAGTHWHRALDAQGWTDLVSNITSLTPITIEDDPRPWLAWGKAKPHNLSVFLHEATHHWCFTSPVAFTIAGLTLRARLAMVRAVNGERHLENSIVEDLIRAETAVALLRPVAEGLALFAEFDATSRIKSKAISPVLQTLLQFFIDPHRSAALYQELPGEVAIAAAIGKAIYDLRTDLATLNRKASLLLKPLSFQTGGYLSGYLAVKSLWRAASSKHFSFANETDSFLMYLRSYIYDDWGLVSCLLSREWDEIRGAENVLNYVSQRINEWDELVANDFAEYETAIAVDGGSNRLFLPGIRVHEETAELGKQRLDDLTNELVASSRGEETTTTAIAAWSTSLLQRRHFMNLTSVPVEIRAVPNGLPEVRWNGHSILQPKPDDFRMGLEESLGEAQLEVILSFRGDRFERAAVVHRDNKVLLCITFGLERHTDETRQNVLSVFLTRPLVIKSEEYMRSVVDQIVTESWFRIAIDHCKLQLDRLMEPLYKDISLRFARDYAALDSCVRIMSQGGLKPILKSSSLVKGLALLGLATSLNPEEVFINEVFEKHRLSLPQTLAQLESAYEYYGYPPTVMKAGKQLFTTI
jgi:hypothetical protein